MLCQQANRSLRVLAPAKLNLFLRVVDRRADGFHDLETVMTTINLYDTLLFEPLDTDEIRLRVVMSAATNRQSAAAETITCGPQNLVFRAAQLLRDYAGRSTGVQITLIKRIPSAAGLGGGSSDAASTLWGLNRFWELQLRQSQMSELAGQLGSDIPFFLAGSSTAVCRGRGERVQPITVCTGLHFVVAKPSSGLSTPEVFRHCRPNNSGPPIEVFLQSIQERRLYGMVRLLLNDLQAPAESLNRDVRNLHQKFNSLPVLGHQMSGSGTSYFGICHSSRHAKMIAGRLRACGVPWVCVARSCS